MPDPTAADGGQRPVRSALFVPANRRAWIEKVHEYGADAVVLDLEDATPPGHKAQARAIVRDVVGLLQRQGQGVWIRVNALGSEHLHEDLEAACRNGVDLICLPKVSGPGDVAELDRLIGYHEGRNGLPHGTIGIYPLLETAQGIADARAVFAASSRVRYGGAVTGANADVQFAIGYRWTHTFTETLHLRSAVLLAARASGIENPVTGLVTTLDADLARRFAEQSRDLGYAGMFVIHPSHVAAANEVFAPTDAEDAWSREILDGYARDLDSDRGAVLDSHGRLVDYAMIRVAEEIAARRAYFTARDRSGA
jgi:citrate lyase subunit beta/citryl-CoA lyase